MSINSVLLTGLSAMRASQQGLATTSQNIANANTPGYVRTEVNLAPRTQYGASGGVEVASIKRAADRFLATASYLAQGAAGASAARYDILARAQSTFGDPNSDSSVFATLDSFWSSLTEISADPSSTLRRDDAVSTLQAMFTQVHRIGQDLQGLIAESDQRIGDAVSEAQSLVNQIANLNDEIRLTKRSGADTSAAENAQSALIDQLSSIMDVQVTPLDEGGVHVRTGGGALLVGVNPAQLDYTPNTAAFATHGVITINSGGVQTNLEQSLNGGELKGLLQVRDQDLAGLADALGGFSASLADALNQVHNENASSPAVSKMVGRNTGLLGTDALGFTGNATIAITSATGVLNNRLSIDFDAQTITSEAPAASYSFAGGKISDFTAALNAALAAGTPAATASFSDGSLTLNAGAGGIVIQQDAADPATRAGRAFSHFFGLNDLVSSANPLFFESGVQGTDPHGFTAGGQITYAIKDAAGGQIAQRTLTIGGSLAAPGSTWDDLISALNTPVSGLGEYGAFALDSATGQVTFTPGSTFSVSLVGDSTSRGTTGVSFTGMNGLSPSAQAGRALDIDVNTLVANDPTRLAVGRPDLTRPLGQRVIEEGDNRGVYALVGARDSARAFSAAGVMSAQTTSLGIYAARLGGEAGRLANDAKRSSDGAAAVATAANDRRAQLEGVSIDDELLKMTTYQNAYAAAARVIQAATDMLDVLMNLGYR